MKEFIVEYFEVIRWIYLSITAISTIVFVTLFNREINRIYKGSSDSPDYAMNYGVMPLIICLGMMFWPIAIPVCFFIEYLDGLNKNNQE